MYMTGGGRRCESSGGVGGCSEDHQFKDASCLFLIEETRGHLVGVTFAVTVVQNRTLPANQDLARAGLLVNIIDGEQKLPRPPVVSVLMVVNESRKLPSRLWKLQIFKQTMLCDVLLCLKEAESVMGENLPHGQTSETDHLPLRTDETRSSMTPPPTIRKMLAVSSGARKPPEPEALWSHRADVLAQTKQTLNIVWNLPPRSGGV